MNFVTFSFILFLSLTFTLFWILPARWRAPLLTVASYVFYATWSLPFIAIILLTTTTDYWMSHIIARSQSANHRKWALISGLVINLGVLGFFKYCNFFLDNVHGLFHTFGLNLLLPESLSIILPLGISFYTFEAISYMVDVYRGKEPARSWLDYNFYIMYFPHLISGPIIRFCELWPQYNKALERPDNEKISKAFELILLGYFLKVVIADQVSPLADAVFNTHKLSVLMTYLGVLAFTVQIYFDFMGYTHIARGASLLFNIELPVNFNYPYLANNISNFWERWHISLSRWIRDYLFIPLGGSRGTSTATASNLIITMLICGAWHGAGWTYILWGGYHGLLLALYRGWLTLRKKFAVPVILRENKFYYLASLLLTFACVVIGWVLFRAHSLPQAFRIIGRLFHFESLFQDIQISLAAGDIQIFMQFAVLLAFCFAGPPTVKLMNSWYYSLPYWKKACVVSALFLLCLVLTASNTAPFIYFQF